MLALVLQGTNGLRLGAGNDRRFFSALQHWTISLSLRGDIGLDRKHEENKSDLPNITNAAYAEWAKWLKVEIGQHSAELGEISTIIRVAVEGGLHQAARDCILFICKVLWGCRAKGCAKSRTERKPLGGRHLWSASMPMESLNHVKLGKA